MPDKAAQALAAFSKAYDGGGPGGACDRAAHFDKDPARKRAFLEKGCAGQNWSSCDGLARDLMKSGAAGERGRAVTMWTARCDDKDGSACAELWKHLGAEPGPAAAEQLQKRCDAGQLGFCNALAGRLARESAGDETVRTRAIALLVSGCQGGFTPSCSALDKYPDSPDAKAAVLASVARAEGACRAKPQFRQPGLLRGVPRDHKGKCVHAARSRARRRPQVALVHPRRQRFLQERVRAHSRRQSVQTQVTRRSGHMLALDGVRPRRASPC